MDGKYKAYPEYRDSGVEWLGGIPKDWGARQLKFLCSYNDEVLSESVAADYEIEYVDIGSVSASEGIKRIETMVFDKAPSRARRIVRDGDVIISTVRTYLEAIAPIENPPGNLIASTGFAVIRPNQYLHNRFAAYCLRAQGFIKEVVARSVGVSYPAINASDLVNIKTPEPPFAEQDTIANFLDHETAKIDTLIEEQQSLIRLLKEKRQAVISHAVTKGLNPDAPMKDSGVEWLGEVPEHWVHNTKLMHIAEETRGSFVNGPFGSDLLSSELKFEGVPVIYIRDVKPTGYFRKSKDCVTPKKAVQLSVCSVSSGDVLVSKVGSPPGDACVYPPDQPDAIITQDVVRIRVDKCKVLPEYLCYLLNSDYGRAVVDNISVESTRKRFSLGDFKQLKLPLPCIKEQASIIANLLQQTGLIDQLIGEANSLSEFFAERRTALISAAVTGKIDVSDWRPATEQQEHPAEATA